MSPEPTTWMVDRGRHVCWVWVWTSSPLSSAALSKSLTRLFLFSTAKWLTGFCFSFASVVQIKSEYTIKMQFVFITPSEIG